MFKKQYTARWVEYNICGIKIKIKSKPKHIDTVNLVLESNYGIGNRIFAIINALEYYSPKRINLFWDNQGWVTQRLNDLFECHLNCNLIEYQEIPQTWTNSENERTIYFPQASLITHDKVERTLAKENITNEIRETYRKNFSKILPSEKVKERIQTISLPKSYIALQVRNAPDWKEYGRNEDLDIFINELNKYPNETNFYLSSMNKETSDYIKNNTKHTILELPNKDYKSMYDAIADFNQYMHKVVAVIDGIQTTIPFNFNTLYDVFPQTMAKRLEEKLLEKFEYNKKVPILEFQKQDDDDLKFLANYVYEKVFLHYTTKQWGVSPNEVDGAVTARVPVYLSKDSRYFQDKYQGIPLEGYTKLIENMLNHQNIKVKLNTDYKDIDEVSDRVFYTGAIDEYFDYEFGQLPYRSVNFKFETYNREFYQTNSVVNYPCNYDFTRIHEYKYYLNDKSEKTVIAKEYSEFFEQGKNERYYPIPNDKNNELYNRYLVKSKNLNNVYFLGRLGDYKYYDMDKAVLRAIELFETITGGKINYDQNNKNN